MYQQIKKGALALSLSLCCVGAFAQKTITGNVKDATGEPLIGVTIQAGKGGTVTDIDGNFSLQNLKPGDKITISYLGCKTQTITVGNQSALNIVMQSTDKSLDEVVVIGYGTMKRRDLTGAVASVTGDKLAQNPVSNIAEALQGQLPGVSSNLSGWPSWRFNEYPCTWWWFHHPEQRPSLHRRRCAGITY